MPGVAGAGYPAPVQAFRHLYADWDDGVADHLLTPGQTGYGLVVWNMPLFGCREEAYSTASLSSRPPFLTVAPTSWRCAYEPDGVFTEWIADELLDYLDGWDEDDLLTFMSIPWVHVKGLRYPDDQWSGFTVEANVSAYHSIRSSGWFTPSLEGLVPLWNVIPIDRDFAETWFGNAEAMWRDYAWGLEHTDQTLCGHAYDNHDFYCDAEDHEYGDMGEIENESCEFELVMRNIMCFADEEFEHESYFDDPEVFTQVFEYGKHRHQQGWASMIERVLEGDECSLPLLRRLSPYSVSATSLDSLRLPEPQRSIA